MVTLLRVFIGIIMLTGFLTDYDFVLDLEIKCQ